MQEITEITTKLKALAKGTQYSDPGAVRSCRVRSKAAMTSGRNSRTCVNRDQSRQDADVVLFVFREEYYHRE